MKTECIYIVFKTHVDLGFTDLPSRVLADYLGPMMDQVTDICDATADRPEGERFVWTLPSWLIRKALDAPAECAADRERRRKLEECIRRKQLIWHALPFTTHTDFSDPEELLRGLGISGELDRQFGRETISAKMTDVPGHSRSLPSLLAMRGVRFLHLGCNACSTAPDLPRLFRWEGPDGADVLTWYSRDYGTPLLPPADWPYPVWLAMQQTHDNQGAPDPQSIDRMFRKIREASPGTEIRIGSMDDFARHFLSLAPADLPVVKEDLADCWIHGIGTYPDETGRMRELRKQVLVNTDILAARECRGELGIPFGEFRNINRDIYEQMLLFDEHTWGLDTKVSLLPGRNSARAYEPDDLAADREAFPETYNKIEQSWEEKRDYLRQAEELHRRLGAGLNRSGGAGSASPGGETAMTRKDGLLIFDNGLISLTADPATGNLSGLTDRLRGTVWNSRGNSLFEYIYEVVGKKRINRYLCDYASDLADWYINDFGKPGYPFIEDEICRPVFRSLSYSREPEGYTLTLEFWGNPHSAGTRGDASEITLILSLPDRSPSADLTVMLKGKKKTAFLEAGHLSLNLDTGQSALRYDKVSAPLDPRREIRKDANHQLHCCGDWLRCSGINGDLTVIPLDTPLFSLGESGIGRYLREPAAPGGPVLFNLFNNQWGTNFPQWIGGDLAFRFRLHLHGAETTDRQLMAEAASARRAFAGGLPEGPGIWAGGSETLLLRGLEPLEPGTYTFRIQNYADRRETGRCGFTVPAVSVSGNGCRLDGEDLILEGMAPWEIRETTVRFRS